jgi:glycosyltransferase involved in cell wall biosynthesis
MDPKAGGVCQALRDMIHGITSNDQTMLNEVVCLDDPGESFLSKDSFKIYALGNGQTSWSYNKKLFYWLDQHYDNYDKIIVHGLWQYHSHVVGQLRKTRKFTYYIMPHGMLDPWFQRDKSRKLKAIRNEIFWKLAEKRVVNNADGLLFTCEQELLLARETFKGYNPKKELNVGLGIQMPPEQTEEMQPAISRNAYLLFLSRIHPKKGVDLLIHAYKQLKSEIPEIPELVIAGPLDSAYASKMQSLAADCQSIHFTGMLQGNAKWGAIYGCEAFILPSHQENFGIAVVEAMACGKPVLISNQVNIWKEIERDRAGIISSDTIEGMKEQLVQWLRLPADEKLQMAKNAKLLHRKNFSIEEAARKMKEALMQ